MRTHERTRLARTHWLTRHHKPTILRMGVGPAVSQVLKFGVHIESISLVRETPETLHPFPFIGDHLIFLVLDRFDLISQTQKMSAQIKGEMKVSS